MKLTGPEVSDDERKAWALFADIFEDKTVEILKADGTKEVVKFIGENGSFDEAMKSLDELKWRLNAITGLVLGFDPIGKENQQMEEENKLNIHPIDFAIEASVDDIDSATV